MPRLKTPLITVRASAYRHTGETITHPLRAAVVADGMKVSCPAAWRDQWQEGELFDFVGHVVDSKGAPYFRATTHTRANLELTA